MQCSRENPTGQYLDRLLHLIMHIKALGKGRPALITLFTAVSQAMYKMQTWFRRSFCMVVISLSLSLFFICLYIKYGIELASAGAATLSAFDLTCHAQRKISTSFFAVFVKKQKKKKTKTNKNKNNKKKMMDSTFMAYFFQF